MSFEVTMDHTKSVPALKKEFKNEIPNSFRHVDIKDFVLW